MGKLLDVYNGRFFKCIKIVGLDISVGQINDDTHFFWSGYALSRAPFAERVIRKLFARAVRDLAKLSLR